MDTILVEGLTRLRELYSQGLYLQAYQAGQEAMGPLRDWPAPEGRVLAGRLANNLGARRLGRWLFLHAYRRHPHDAEACFFYVWYQYERRGPLAAWEFLKRRGDLPDASHKTRADWYALHCRVLSMLRDFEAAEHWIERARLIAEDRAWIWVEYAFLLEREDRYEEALAAAQHALSLQPWYRPAVQAVAHELTLLSRHEEARELLTEAGGRLESGDVLVQLAMIEAEHDRHRQAADHIEQAIQLFPLLEDDYCKWLRARCCDAEYRLGNDQRAVELAREAGGPFYEQLAEKLAAHQEGRRVALPVGFVRQHHVTCAPATLSAISRYWSMPADHLDVAQRICYDGTPAHSERRWAEDNGWIAREFTVTWDSARELIDRGIPFTLTTVGPGASHLQAVIGYDSRLRTLVVRDPTEPYATEMLVDSLLEVCRSTGPRGMTLVPHDQQDRLDGIELPDASLYDAYYKFQWALEEHDRPRAKEFVDQLIAADPEHRLTLSAQLVLARYDNDPPSSLVSVERLLEKYPEDLNLQLWKVSTLRELARRDERLAVLEKLYAEGRRDWMICQNLARELRDDARELPRVVRLLKKALRTNPTDGDVVFTLAGVCWDRLEWNRATDLFRFAACLADKDESLAKSYFLATRYLKRVDEALRFLQGRFARYGRQSSWPARTLCWAYESLNRANEAFDTVTEALRMRPDDGTLMLYAADLFARHNRTQQADEMLARAEHRSHAQAWRRTAASIAQFRGDHVAALAHWRAVAEAEPLAADAHSTLASMLAEGGDREGALAHLRQVSERFPYNYALRQLLIEWLRASDPQETEAAVRKLLEIHPVDAWGHRELALTLVRLGRNDEALAEANFAAELDPANPSTFTVRGLIHSRIGHVAEAKEDFRRAIRLSVDNEHAIDGLMAACDNEAQRREALEFIRGQLQRQVIFGDGLTSFRQYARNTLKADELLAVLSEARQARPDLWTSWSALVGQLTEMQRLDEALQIAEEACQRFPLLPRIWLDLAIVHRSREDREGEMQALQRALEINPSWGPPARRLAEIHEEAGDLNQSRAVLELAVSRDPGDAINLGCLADALWRLGEKQEAIDRLQRALRLDPGYEWGWDTLPRWLAEFERQSEVVDLAREITTVWPGEARSWLILSRVLPDGEASDEALAALDRAIALNPCLIEAHDLKAERLTEAGRFDEALAACRPNAWPERPPIQLRARAADVLYVRGQQAEAIGQMKSVVAEEPDYHWAWYRLATWYYDDANVTDEYLEAAQQLERISPHYPPTWGHLGCARLRNGDRAGAKEAFRRALEVAPEYVFAGQWLIDLHLEDNELDDAEQALAVLKQHDQDGFTVARELALACRRRDRTAALQHLRALCGTRQDEPWPFNYSVDSLREAGYARAARRVLREALAWPEVNPQAGPAWLSLCSDWSWPLWTLSRMHIKGEAWRRASVARLEKLANTKQGWKIALFAHRHAELLMADDGSWDTVAWALLQSGRYRDVVDWTGDWASRPHIWPHPLFYRAVALWSLDRIEEGLEASRHAMDLPPDSTTPLHQLWLAAGDVLADQPSAAAARLAEVDPEQLTAYYRALAALLQSAVEQLGASSKVPFGQFRRQLRASLAPHWVHVQQDGLLNRLYHRILRHAALSDGNHVAAVWHAMLSKIA